MNTATEFYEWLMTIEQDPSAAAGAPVGPSSKEQPAATWEVDFADGDDSQPSLACTVGSSSTADTEEEENSSLDTSLHSISTASASITASPLSKSKRKASPKRSVSFSSVEVREYAVTVGDHPFCFDGLPLTLDWEHTPDATVYDIEVSRQRMEKYRLPKRLSYEERREKLFSVSDYSQDRVRDEEINMVINLLQQSWAQHNHILPMPDISEIIEDDDDDEECATTIKPYFEEIRWKRNPVKRSQSFRG